MRCPNCDHDGPDRSQFCESCGVLLSVTCRGCGGDNRPNARFCTHCGAYLAAEPLSPALVMAPGGVIPGHLKERILTSRQALLGERKQVTVLFADTKGSTEQIQRADPEEVARRLGPVLKTMIDAVHYYEATVSRVLGDGIMALFGAPLAQEDHATRACHAALAMQRAIKAIAGGTVEIRVGLHSGEVVVRSISDDLSMHYDAVGMTVHLASRMEQLAAPGTICLTGETYKQAQEFVAAEPLGPTRIKGLDQPIEIFKLSGTRSVRTRWQARATRSLTKFVGREVEIASLQAALARVREGKGEMIAVVGDPGTGKSRVVHEFLHSNSVQGVTLFETGAATYGKNSPYLPITNLLRARLKISDRDAPEEIANKVRLRFAFLGEKLPSFQTVLHALLDLNVDRAWQELDLLQRRRRINDAVKMLLLKAAEERPVLVVLDDLQWIDAETQAILDELIESLVQARVLLLVTYRPEYNNPWVAKGLCRSAELQPLTGELALKMLKYLLGDSLALEQIKRLLIERTGGNPLFLEESVRALVEVGALEGQPGDYRPAKDIQQITVPATVKAVLAARIDRLGPDSRSVLDVASTIGRNVPVALLQAVANISEERLRRLLAELQAGDFLYESRPLPNQEYAFKHALTRDVAYESMLLEARQTLHAQIAAKIEQLHEGRLDEQVDNLAEHTYHAGQWPAAVKFLLQACIRAVNRSAPRAAVALFERGLTALAHLPEGAARAKAGVDLRLVALNALIPLGDHAHIVQHLTEAESLARSLGDQRRLGLVYSQLAVAFWMAGKHDRALEAGEQALAAANALGHRPSQIGARFTLGMVHHALGNLAQAIDIQREILKDFLPEMERERVGWVGYPSVLIRTFLAGTLVERGEFAEAERHLETGCRIADELGHPYSRAMIYAIVGQLLVDRGEFERATDVLERMLKLCWEEEVWAMYPMIAARLSTAHARSGRIAEAVATLEHALQPSVYRKGATYTWLYLYLAAGEAYLRAGRLEDARINVEKAEALARSNNEQAHLACTLKLRGEILAASDNAEFETVTRSYLEAIALAEARGMQPLLAHCHLSLGSFLARRNRLGEAAPHLARGVELYRVLGMVMPAPPPGQEPSSAALSSIGRPRNRSVL